MTLWAFLRLLATHGFRVSRSKLGVVAVVIAASLVNSATAGLVRLIYGRRLRRVAIAPDPLFIIGFQRSGTTFLNELLAKDPRLASPTTMHCVWPETYLISRYFLRAVMRLAMSKKRPMDNVAWNPEAPQEDEVAMLTMGGPSPYSTIAFPNDLDRFGSTLRLENEDEVFARRWMRRWLSFLRQVQYLNPEARLLLKSPTHTTRIARLLEQFPNAKFVHITRDPYRIFSSNVKLSVALPMAFCLQDYEPDFDERRRAILDGFVRFHQTFDRSRHAIPDGNYVQICYEQLVRDPEATLREVYQALDLGDFAPVEGPLRAVIETQKDYKTNLISMEPDDIKGINEAWTSYFDTYGYEKMTAEKPRVAASA
ncbi:MAG: sulfotransferase [Pseudomonadota bacterium]